MPTKKKSERLSSLPQYVDDVDEPYEGRPGGAIYPSSPIEGAPQGRFFSSLKTEEHDAPETHDEARQANETSPADEVIPENTPSSEHMLGWYVKKQIKASPLTPAEIAERSGVSVSQIYRFIKGERSLTLESADKILPIVGRSLVEAIRRHQDGPSSPEMIAGEIEDERERLRQRLDEWEKCSYADVNNILEDVGRLAARIRKVLDEL